MVLANHRSDGFRLCFSLRCHLFFTDALLYVAANKIVPVHGHKLQWNVVRYSCLCAYVMWPLLPTWYTLYVYTSNRSFCTHERYLIRLREVYLGYKILLYLYE